MRNSLVVAACLTAGAVVAAAPSRSFARPIPTSSVSAIAPNGQDADGRLLYLKNCRTCHGATGLPSAENKDKYPKIKALNDASFLAGLSDDSLLTVLKKGKGKDMKSWADKLSQPEMVAVIKYVRTLPKKGA
jgi:mono/diheme cytochrome c family protein